MQFINKKMSRDNALTILHRAVELQVHDIADACTACLAKNFCYVTLLPQQVSALDSSCLLALVSHPQIAVKDEWPLYKLINGYLQLREDVRSDPTMVHKLLECVRFRWLNYDQMAEVEANQLVPRELVVEALMARLKQHEVTGPVEPGSMARFVW